MLFSLVIPCYNEGKNVRAMYEEVVRTFFGCGFSYEMVFVNDGSSDDTAQEIKKLCREENENIVFLDFSRNFGKESAIFAGLENCSGDYAVIIDGDLQQPPQVALEMAKFLMDNPDYDCVTACQEKRIESKFSGFVKSRFYKTINSLADVNLKADASDFRTMNRNMINAVLSMKEKIRFSKGIFAWVGFKTKYIPYTPSERHAGESKWNFSKLTKYALDGILSFSPKLVKIPLVMSALMILASIIFLVIRLIAGGFTEVSALIFLSLLLCGILLFAISVASVYIGRIYEEAKDRPVYILRQKIKTEKKR